MESLEFVTHKGKKKKKKKGETGGGDNEKKFDALQKTFVSRKTESSGYFKVSKIDVYSKSAGFKSPVLG